MVYTGLGVIKDPEIAQKLTWTEEDMELFFELLKTHKNDLMLIASRMNKSFLEISAFVENMERESQALGPIDQREIPIAYEVPEDFVDEVEPAPPGSVRIELAESPDGLFVQRYIDKFLALHWPEWDESSRRRCLEVAKSQLVRFLHTVLRELAYAENVLIDEKQMKSFIESAAITANHTSIYACEICGLEKEAHLQAPNVQGMETLDARGDEQREHETASDQEGMDDSIEEDYEKELEEDTILDQWDQSMTAKWQKEIMDRAKKEEAPSNGISETTTPDIRSNQFICPSCEQICRFNISRHVEFEDVGKRRICVNCLNWHKKHLKVATYRPFFSSLRDRRRKAMRGRRPVTDSSEPTKRARNA